MSETLIAVFEKSDQSADLPIRLRLLQICIATLILLGRILELICQLMIRGAC